MPNKLVVLLLLLPTIACAQQPTNIGSAVFPPDHITVQTGTPTIAVGQTATFTATLVLADGSSNIDVTPQCSWSSNNNSIASFADPGLAVATGIAVGSVTITCILQSNPASITVNTATLTVSSSPIILTPLCGTPPCVLPAGTNGSAYVGYALTATGGTLPYTWTVATGSLPTGLSLTNTGCGSNVGCMIGGTPSMNGTSTFSVKVTDALGANNTSQNSTITISAAPCLSGLSYNPPTTYCSTTSTSVDTWPTFAPTVYTGVLGTNNFATETSTTGLGNGAYSVVRVSDSLSASQGSSTMSEPLSHGFSCQPQCNGSGNYFFFVRTNNGGAAWYQFNAANFPSSNPITWMGNVIAGSDGTQFSQDDKQWSYNKPNVFYSSGTTASSSSYIAATLGYYTVNLATAAPWTSSNFTHTVLLDPVNDVTNPCNGLGNTPTSEWNKYLYVSPGDNRITSADSGGAGTNIVTTFFRYQVDQGRIVVVYDGTATSGSRCTWIDSATGMISIHGAAAVPINGFGPLPAPAAPSVTLNTGGGNLTCPTSSNGFYIEQTYTIANVGETTPSPVTSILSGGSGSTCSWTVAPPSSSPSLVGFTGIHPTGHNEYFCQGTPLFCSNQSNFQLVSSLYNSSFPTATCTVTTGTSQYSYYVIQVSSSGMSVPSAVTSTGTNCANRLGSGSPGTPVSVSSSRAAYASSITVCRDFLNVCFQNQGGAFTDKGGSPTLFVTQTNLIANSMTYTGSSVSGIVSCPTCTPPTVNTAGINMHGNGITGPGYVSLAVPDYEKPNAKVLVNVQNGNAITLDLGNAGAQVNPCDGHAPSTIDWLFCLGTSEALLHFTLSDNATNVQASQFNMFSTVALGNPNQDRHTMYPDMRTDNFVLGVDTYPLPLSYCSPGGSCASTSFPWDGEYLGFPSNNTNAPFRFARNWTSGQNFNSSARGNISQDGKYAIFNSDGLRNGTGSSSCASTGACGFGGFSGNTTTTGCTPGASGNCRSEVMLIKLN